MSFSNKGKDEYVNIEDLTELNSISDGDKFIIQSSDGETSLVDYSSIKIDIDHTTFKTSYQEMIEFTATASQFVDTISGEFETIKGDFSLLQKDFDEIKALSEAIKLWIKFIYLGFSGEAELNRELSELSAVGQEKFLEIKSIIDDSYSVAHNGGKIFYSETHLTRNISL